MLDFELVNMFADRPFAGSPLGVVAEADALSPAAMHSIARELNAPETAFALPPSSPAADYRVRVFTPAGESPYGGHSAVGTAVTLAAKGIVPEGAVVQQCGSQLLELVVSGDRAALASAGAPSCRRVDPAPLLAGAGLGAEHLLDSRAVQAGFGSGFHYLWVRSDALARARLDAERLRASGLKDIVLADWDGERHTAGVRLFAPGYGIPEDPACAPVALGLGAWLVDVAALPPRDGTHRYRIEQGADVQRPSTLDCTVTVAGGRATRATVAGRVVSVARGQLQASSRDRAMPGGAGTPASRRRDRSERRHAAQT